MEFSVIWGLFCFLLYEAVHPLISDLVKLIPIAVLKNMDIGLAIIMAIDMIATVNTLIGLNKEFKAIDRVSKDIRKVSDKIGIKVYDRTIQIENKQEELKKKPEFIELENRIKELKERKEGLEEKRILKAFPNLTKNLEDAQAEIAEIKKLIRDNEHL